MHAAILLGMPPGLTISIPIDLTVVDIVIVIAIENEKS